MSADSDLFGSFLYRSGTLMDLFDSSLYRGGKFEFEVLEIFACGCYLL